ncbi:S8 family serine peptidase [Scopulibacillus darangshiensis]|uniref:S8 family serine peptidase n=1 Tax=Scopulibacillus darangshiensis TaxID=442528 RepID=UPI0014046A98|nr:S8 family serine peptidase [Scopulibacillus darangshiensis]
MKHGYKALSIAALSAALLASPVASHYVNAETTVKKPKAHVQKLRKSEWNKPERSGVKTLLRNNQNAAQILDLKGQHPKVKDEYLVKFKDQKSAKKVKKSHKMKTLKKLSAPKYELIHMTEKTAKKLVEEGTVESIQPNYKYKPLATTDEPLFNKQWALENNGQSINAQKGAENVDLDAVKAWDITKGSEDVIVADIDTGVDINHPDLKDSIWTNKGEIPDNGTDDDGNGYIDDVHGWDFYNRDNTVYDKKQGDDHGTHVTGILAASENGKGVVGIAPRIKVMPLKFLGPQGGTSAMAIDAIAYAKKMGARIINASWGSGPNDPALKTAIENSGMLFVTAAGNYGWNIDDKPSYPASFDSPNILSVAAVDNSGKLASYSNYGANSVDIAAPGTDIMSTVPASADIGVAAEITAGKGKVIFNDLGFENFKVAAERKDAFNRAIDYLGVKSDSKILLVEDDNEFMSPDFLPVYKALLDGAGLTYDTVSVDDVWSDGPNLDKMKNYDAVIWFTGEENGGFNTTTLKEADQQNLMAYVKEGGSLLLTGPDSLDEINDSEFVKSFLHLDHQWGWGMIKSTAKGKKDTAYDGVTSYSAYHRWVDALSSNDPSHTKIDLYYPGNTYANAYEYYSGTSMAVPYVAGAAALVWGEHPDLTAEQVSDILQRSGKPLADLDGKVKSGKMVDAYNAVTADPGDGNNDIPGIPFKNDRFDDSLDSDNDTDDVLKVDLKAGETLNLALHGEKGTDYDLYVFDRDAKTVDTSSGITAYSENEGTSAEAVTFTAKEAGSYYIDVYAYDGAGDYTLIRGNGPGSYDDKSEKITYKGDWQSIDDDNVHAKKLESSGTAEFTFVGTNIAYKSYKDNTQGLANVYIDNKLVAAPSLYSKTPQYDQVIFSKDVSFGVHTVRIEWAGKRDPEARRSHADISLDGFVVTNQ